MRSLARRHRAVAHVSLTDIDAFVEGLGGRLAPTSVAASCSTLRAFLAFLFAKGSCRTDLAGLVISPRIRRLNRPPRALPRVDVQRILRAIQGRSGLGPRDFAIFLMMATYGMGAGEIAGLTLDDADWTARTTPTGAQPQVPATRQIPGAAHVPHEYDPPQPFETAPQLLPAHAVVIGTGVQLQTPAALQVPGAAHVPHEYDPPQPFETAPQLLPAHAVVIGLGVHVQTFAALQTLGDAQEPQFTVRLAPQLSVPLTAPQFLPRRAQNDALDSREQSARYSGPSTAVPRSTVDEASSCPGASPPVLPHPSSATLAPTVATRPVRALNLIFDLIFDIVPHPSPAAHHDRRFDAGR